MQLKRYFIIPGAWEDYIDLWRRIAVVRKNCGFDIPFAVAERDRNLFTWAISHTHFADGAARYYADPQRRQLSRTDYDPATGSYFDSGRNDQKNIEDFIANAEINFVVAEPIP